MKFSDGFTRDDFANNSSHNSGLNNDQKDVYSPFLKYYDEIIQRVCSYANTVSSAWLLVGDFDKLLLALEIAKILLVKHSLALNKHDVLMRIDSSVHRDLLVIDETGEITIELVRKTRSFLQTKSSESTMKIIIINNAEMMNQFAANALLKSIEDFESAVILLLSKTRQSVQHTIQSRCLLLQLEKNTRDKIKKWLANYTPFVSLNNRTREVILASSNSCFCTIVKLCGGEPGYQKAISENDCKTYDFQEQIAALIMLNDFCVNSNSILMKELSSALIASHVATKLVINLVIDIQLKSYIKKDYKVRHGYS
jgi:anti-anti-sigma regulatory factor